MICTRFRVLLKWKWKHCNLLTISPVDVEKWKNISFHKKTTGVCHHRSKDPLLLTACCLAAGAVVNQQYTRRRHYLSPHTHYLSSLRCLPRTELATRLVHMSAPHLICCSLPQQIQLTTHTYIKVHTHTELSLWLCWRHDLSERETHTTFSSPHPPGRRQRGPPGKNDRAAIVFVILAQFDIQREKANDVLLTFLLYSQPQSTKQNVPDIVHHHWQVANYHQVEVSVESRLVSLTPDHLFTVSNQHLCEV